MAKIVAWLVLIFIVLLALRLVNARNARIRRGAQSTRENVQPDVQPMVKCGQCGVFLPRADAKVIGNATYACADGQCGKRG